MPRSTLLLAVLALPSLAHTACVDGRYFVDRALLPGAAIQSDVVTIAGGTVAIASGCAPVRARFHRTLRGVFVRATWPECTGVEDVRLRLAVDAECTSATGRLSSRRPPSRVRFDAVTTPPGCDGPVGVACNANQFCEHPASTCGTPAVYGTCVPLPGLCLQIYLPVCGCDGVTYPSDCERRKATVQKAYEGVCTPD